jgi:hypothetical protein
VRGVDLRRTFHHLEESLRDQPCAHCAERRMFRTVCIDPEREEVRFADTPCPTCGRTPTLIVYSVARQAPDLGRFEQPLRRRTA